MLRRFWVLRAGMRTLSSLDLVDTRAWDGCYLAVSSNLSCDTPTVRSWSFVHLKAGSRIRGWSALRFLLRKGVELW